MLISRCLSSGHGANRNSSFDVENERSFFEIEHLRRLRFYRFRTDFQLDSGGVGGIGKSFGRAIDVYSRCSQLK